MDHEYFLTGKVFCAHCGCRLTPKSANHPGRKKSYTAYYECYRLSKYRGFPCEVRRMNAEVLEKLFLDIVSRLGWDKALVTDAAAAKCPPNPGLTELKFQGNALSDRLREMEGGIANLLKAVEEGLAGAAVQDRLRELEKQKAILQSEIIQVRLKLDQIQARPIDVEQAMALFRRCSELLPQMNADQKEKLTDAILKRATVSPDKSVEFELNVGLEPDDVVQNAKCGCRTRTQR